MQSPELGAPLGQAAPDKARRPQVARTLDPPPSTEVLSCLVTSLPLLRQGGSDMIMHIQPTSRWT